MERIELKREFIWKSARNGTITLQDPDADMTPNEVLGHFSLLHPELNNASCTGPEIRSDKKIYTFSSVVGTKG